MRLDHILKKRLLLWLHFGRKQKKSKIAIRSLELAMHVHCMAWREFVSTMEMKVVLRKTMRQH